jgi:protein-S-isoprenylcysteine O-methyltransferase Ste14
MGNISRERQTAFLRQPIIAFRRTHACSFAYDLQPEWYTPATGEPLMGATKIEFRLRMVIVTVTAVLGFWSPWIGGWGIGRRISLLEWLALELSRLGLIPFTAAAPLAIVFGILIAALGAALRVWSTAYLGSEIVKNAEMKAGAVMADGPYRYLRNPLYLGLWFVFAATAFIMPASGALVSLLLLTVFLFRLTLGEEAFLSPKLGEAYHVYLHAVPRLIPRLRSALPSAGAKPRWGQALVYEIYPIGVFVTLATLSWSYNNRLMAKAVLVSFGLALIGRALLPKNAPDNHSAN